MLLASEVSTPPLGLPGLTFTRGLWRYETGIGILDSMSYMAGRVYARFYHLKRAYADGSQVHGGKGGEPLLGSISRTR